jgi:high-affinity nickel-transport protein
MTTGFVSVSGLSLIFALGLRHGFDPDHIAMIDSLTYRSLTAQPKISYWVGTLFALGHGLAVTMIAVVLGATVGTMKLPSALNALFEWLPIALLLLVGTLNLRDLLSGKDYGVVGWKTRFMPQWLLRSSHPLAIFAIGIVFALVFDTATQAAAWGYAASAHSNVLAALIVGLVFTAGMAIADTVDGRLMVRFLHQVSDRSHAVTYRRAIGWMIVAMSYGIALFVIAKRLFPTLDLNDSFTSIAGFALFFALLLGYILFARRRSADDLAIRKE